MWSAQAARLIVSTYQRNAPEAAALVASDIVLCSDPISSRLRSFAGTMAQLFWVMPLLLLAAAADAQSTMPADAPGMSMDGTAMAPMGPDGYVVNDVNFVSEQWLHGSQTFYMQPQIFNSAALRQTE